MVAGAVIPPRIDLENEDLLRAHVHALWLTVSGAHLQTSLRDVLDVAGDPPTLDVMPDLASKLHDPVHRAATHARARAALGPAIAAMVGPTGDVDTWLASTLRELPARFEAACQRWRSLYRATSAQLEQQNRRIRDASLDAKEREAARRLHADALAQLNLLLDASDDQHADFYSYRYFASEGFLPGYNFPRLPLSAFLPGRRKRRGETDDFLSRPRFLAISEFGPRAIVYHEGARYPGQQGHPAGRRRRGSAQRPCRGVPRVRLPPPARRRARARLLRVVRPGRARAPRRLLPDAERRHPAARSHQLG
jgi:hypothetical protein